MAPAQKRRKVDTEDDVLASESVSRLKAAVRQANRLLAREDVKLELRQTTERRLEALQTQLEIAQSRKKEQKMATRYHGLRFIERKKVLRKLNQVKKESPQDKALKAALLAHRIDLHYILTFPKDRKYIALYPDGEYVPPDAPTTEDATDKERAALRKSIKKRMKRGELDAEPELHLDRAAEAAPLPKKAAKPKAKRKAVGTAADTMEQDVFFDV